MTMIWWAQRSSREGRDGVDDDERQALLTQMDLEPGFPLSESLLERARLHLLQGTPLVLESEVESLEVRAAPRV